jgi:hypothetical protein
VLNLKKLLSLLLLTYAVSPAIGEKGYELLIILCKRSNLANQTCCGAAWINFHLQFGGVSAKMKIISILTPGYGAGFSHCS